MNADEVCEMIDAITEGRDYVLRPKVEEGWQSLAIGVSGDSILFTTENDFLGTRLTDPRTAREIAGALVAWANRKDGRTGRVRQNYEDCSATNPDEMCPDCREGYDNAN